MNKNFALIFSILLFFLLNGCSFDNKTGIWSGDKKEKEKISKIETEQKRLENTVKIYTSDNFFKVLWNNALKDEFDKSIFKSQFNNMNKFKFNSNDIKAFSILGVSVGLKWSKIQEKFKKLVKKFHPDMNSGNKNYEEKLKIITLAYTQLKNTYRGKIDT